MPDNPNSRVTRASYGKRETETELLEADNTSIRFSPDGFLIVELFRYGANNRAVEGYRFEFCPEDAERLLKAK